MKKPQVNCPCTKLRPPSGASRDQPYALPKPKVRGDPLHSHARQAAGQRPRVLPSPSPSVLQLGSVVPSGARTHVLVSAPSRRPLRAPPESRAVVSTGLPLEPRARRGPSPSAFAPRDRSALCRRLQLLESRLCPGKYRGSLQRLRHQQSTGSLATLPVHDCQNLGNWSPAPGEVPARAHSLRGIGAPSAGACSFWSLGCAPASTEALYKDSGINKAPALWPPFPSMTARIWGRQSGIFLLQRPD
ncbi:hypothetical protein H920_04434 [Fukomys damarensis]|uniref:Uncharacterized protein n=1 Tax=Fukomys damarensis TaxID=885580 RepID=A0A091DUE2_FUKDA|nr:hypothetical protein H920_04434 [Fukomys damarensis]